MKIVVAGPAGPYGGLEVHTTELSHFLSDSGHEILPIQVFPQHGGLRGKAAKLGFWVYSSARVLAFQPDLLISVGLGQGYGRLARSAGARCFRILQVVTDDFRSNPNAIASILPSFDAIATQTATLKQVIGVVVGSSAPVSVLPCFHQILEQNSPSPHVPCPAAGHGIRLAYFGRLAGNKGLPLLLEAISQLNSPLLEVLDVWGNGPVRNELESLIRNDPEIAARVSLKGSYPGGQHYGELLSTYHGLVLPSQACEGLPLVLLEAASVGLPILTTRIGGIQDFALSNPDVLTVDLGLSALRSGLEKFLTQIQMQTFQRQRQQAFFTRHYSRHAIEERWSDLLGDVHRFFASSEGSPVSARVR